MPFTIHEGAVKKQMYLNVSKPQEAVSKDIPENWAGTANQGLPVIEIPHFEFPKVVYMHPNEPFQKVTYRNDKHEIVDEEEIPTEHLTKTVGCEAHIKSGGPKDCADCRKAFEAALDEGWVADPYMPKAPEKQEANLYGPRKKNLSKNAEAR